MPRGTFSSGENRGKTDLRVEWRTGQVALPVGVIPTGKVAAEVDAARLLPLPGRPDHEPGDGEEVLQLPAGPGVEFTAQGVAAPEGDVAGRLLQAAAVADDAHLADHQA